MNSIHKLNTGLGLLLVVLLLLNLQQEDSAYQPLTTDETGAISAITLKSSKRSISFLKQQDSWRLATSAEKKINPQTIKKLLGIMQTHSYRQFDNTPANRLTFKLEQPLYQILLDNRTISFGDIEPTQQLRYILLDNRIHLISDLYLQYLLADETFFYDK